MSPLTLDQILSIDGNREQWEQFCYVVGDDQREKSTVILMVLDSHAVRDKLYKEVRSTCEFYKHHLMDLTSKEVVSLVDQMKKDLPKAVVESKPVEHMVHVFGLENSIKVSKDGVLTSSDMLPEVNFQRELLFAMPFITILWADKNFEKQLQLSASDLSSWLSYRFHFKGPEPEQNQERSIPEPSLYTAVSDEVLEKLEQYQEAYSRIKIGGKDTPRRIKEQLSVLIPWGRTLTNARQFELAELKLLEGLKLSKLLQDKEIAAQAQFYLGNLFRDWRKYQESITFYQSSLRTQKEVGWKSANGSTYHQLGMVYQEQRNWSEAIAMYEKAIETKEKTGQEHQLGTSYHQLGIVYQEQRNWQKAIAMYEKAIDSDEQTGQEHQLGTSYHQLGMVYHEQRNWSEAIAMYEKALDSFEQTGQEHELGGTYHQLGRVYQEQRNWLEAIAMYEKAIETKEKTGQEHELGSSYHQLGRVYEERDNLVEAKKHFEKAERLNQEHNSGEEGKEIIQRSLKRVNDKLSEEKK